MSSARLRRHVDSLALSPAGDVIFATNCLKLPGRLEGGSCSSSAIYITAFQSSFDVVGGIFSISFYLVSCYLLAPWKHSAVHLICHRDAPRNPLGQPVYCHDNKHGRILEYQTVGERDLLGNRGDIRICSPLSPGLRSNACDQPGDLPFSPAL